MDPREVAMSMEGLGAQLSPGALSASLSKEAK